MERPDAPLLRTIWDEPYDDASRLVYADWLDENDQAERAEFLRLDIALAADPADASMRRRWNLLLLKHRKRILIDLPRPYHRDIQFDRGFAYPRLNWNSLANFRIMMRNDPFAAPLWHVSFHLPHNELAALPRATEFERVAFLGFLTHGLNGDEGLARLLDNGRLHNVRWLSLGVNQLTDEGLTRLAQLSGMPRLEGLELARNLFTGAGLAELAGAPGLANLRRLGLAGTRLGPDGPSAFVAADCWPRLEQLDLSASMLGNHGVMLLLRWRHLGNLRELDLSGNMIGDDAAAALAVAPGIANLRKLSLARNEIGPVGLQSLIASPFVGNIAELDLRTNRFNGRHFHRDAAVERFGDRVRI